MWIVLNYDHLNVVVCDDFDGERNVWIHNEVDVVLCDDDYYDDDNDGGYQKWKKWDTWRKPTKYSAVWISPIKDYHENKMNGNCWPSD